MPTITLDKKDLLGLIGRKIPDEKLKDKISMIGTDLESIDAKSITVEVFPDRPDMLSAEGFARAISSFMNIKKGLRKYEIKKGNYVVKVDKKVGKVRPCVACAVVKDIKLTDAIVQSLMQVQEKIHKTFGRDRRKLSIGVYDLDTIEFPLVYTTKPKDFTFVPLEMRNSMTLGEILEEHPKGIDYAYLLEGFSEYPIWLDSKGQVLSMPPIINSEETRVTEDTKDLFIDVTGLDINSCEQALNIIITSLADRRGRVYSVKVAGKNYPNLNPKSIRIHRDYVNKILGLNLNEGKIKNYLEMMGLGYKNSVAYVPCYRTDILSEIDLVEDIAIAYGYENFEFELSDFGSVANEDPFEIFKNKVSDVVVSFGLIETNTYNLSKKDDQTKNMKIEMSLIEVANALNEEYNVLRAWMIPSMLDVLRGNRQYDYPQKIFEIGTVFTDKGEITRLSCALSGAVGFTDGRQILDGLLRSLGLEGKYKDKAHSSFIQGRVARVSVKGKDVAYVGEIHPGVLVNFGLEMPVTCFELNLTELFKVIKK